MVRCRQTKLFLISPTAFPSQTRSSMESCKSGREHISEGSIIIVIIIIIVIFTIRNQHWWSSASSQSWRRVSCQSWIWRLGSLTGWILKWCWRITPRQDMSPPSFWSHIVQPIHFSLAAIFLLCRHDPFPRCNGTPQYKHTPQILVFGRSLQTGRQTTSQVIFAPRQRVHFSNHQRRLTFIPRLLQDN